MNRSSLRIDFIWLSRYWPELINVGWGITIAVFLFAFQACVFVSFWKAGALFVERFDGEVWVRPPGVECFEAPGLLDARYQWQLHASPGVERVEKVVFGFVPWKAADGRWANVALIGYSRMPERPRTVFFERTDAGRLHTPVGGSAEVGGLTTYAGGTLDGFSSFLGMPYTLSDYRTAEAILRLPSNQTNFLVISTIGDPAATARHLQDRFPELEFVTKARMSFDSSMYWVKETGAGGAILSAALLAVVVGFIFSFFSVLRFTDRIRRDLVTLLLIGAKRSSLSRTIVLFCSGIALMASLIGALTVLPFSLLVQLLIPWVQAIPAVLVGSIALGTVSGGAAAWWASRALHGMDEMEAFRGQ